MKTAPQQSRLKIIPWDVIKANEAAGAIDLTQNENEDDIFSLDEAEQQELPTLALPDPLREKLFTHQHYGVNWMFNLFNQNEKGGILADDMGLGKTLQVTSFLAGTMMADRLHTSLVLTPKSVIPSWERELNNNLKAHLPEVQVVVIDANMKKKQRSTLLGAVEVSNRRSKHIIIMSHHLLLTMIEEVERICWDCVVLDEGHIIKNTTTKMSQTMHQLRSPFRLLLSGTPIQNDLKEFWALVNWATQGSRFGREADFRKTFADPILRGQDPSAGERSRALAAEARLSLIRVIRPVLLRRKKADQRQKELQLPEKKELVLWIRLSTKQRQQYYEYVHSRRYEEVMRQATYPVEVINTLKTICRHPILLRADQHKDVDELDTAMQRLGLGDAADEAPSQSHGKGHFFDVLGRVPTKDELLSQSTKLRVLARMTSRLLNEDHRVLIFSQSKRMLDIIQFLFVDYGYPTFKIDGSTSSEERQNIIDEFNTPGDEYCGPKICLLTTKACGVGINLVGADRVIIFDPSWNPAEDSQAVDRAYRIGQTKPVIVYRLIHSSCVEEKVYQKQVFKEGLRVISEKGNETKRYFAEKSQLRELLALGGKDAVDILRQVPNKMDLLQLDSLFGMDSVIGCTRHDRLYKEDDAPAAVVEADARSCREEALQGRYPVPQPIAAHAMAQQAKRAAAPTKKATPEPPLHFDEVCEDDNRHPTVDLCDASYVESLASTSGALRGRVNAAPCIDLTQSERRGGANSQRSSDASDRSAASLRSTGSQRSAASQRSTASRSAARRRRFDLDDDDGDAVPSNGDAAAKSKRIVVDDDDDAEFDAAPAPLLRAAAPTDDNIDDGDEIDALAAALGDVRVDDGDTVACADAAGPSEGGGSRRVSALTDDGADSDGDETVALVEPDADAAADDDEAAADDDEAAADDDEAAADDDEAAADDDEASASFVDDAADGGLDETEADVVFEAIDDADDDADDDAGDSAAAERAVLGNHVIPLGVAPVWAPVAGEEVDPYDDDYDEGDDEGDEDDAAFNLVAFRSTSTAASAAADASPSSKAAGVGQPPAIGFVSLLSMKELRQLRQQPSASQSEPEPAAATASSSQPTDRSAASQSPADGDRSQPASMGSPAEAASSVDVAVGRAPAPRHTPGLLHQYCNVSLFSPSSTVNSSGVDLSALDASHFDAGDSRRSSTASVAEQAPTAVAAATVAAADPPRRTPLRPAADQFRRSLCDHKRRQLYQQLQQTPLRTPQRPAGSGYLSRIKVIGSSMKTPAAAARPAPQTTAATPHGDGRLVAGLSSGFVDGSFMDSDYDDASGRSSDADRLSPLDKENAPNCRRSSSSTAAASVGKAARARAFSHEASCEIAAELARLVEATHEHAADEEQRRYDEESDERRRGGDSPSVGDLVDQLAAMNVADLAKGAPALLSTWRVSSSVDEDAGASSGLGPRGVHKTLSFDEDAPLAS